MERVLREENFRYRKYRNWWIRPGSCHGNRKSEALRKRRHISPFRIKRRWDPDNRNTQKPSSGNNTLHDCFKDLYHPGNHDKCIHSKELVPESFKRLKTYPKTFCGDLDKC